MTFSVRRSILDRRSFLRGAGACVALPWLDAMRPACTRRERPPVRSVFLFAPNGKKMDDWTPAEEGAGFAAPFLLEPLEPLRNKVLVLSGLALDGARAHGDGPGDHARSAASFLTCAHPRKTGGADIHVGVSVDQVMAESMRGQTPFASLELGMEPGRSAGVCDSGYSCAYSNNISWRAADTPVAKEVDPREVFARLFGDPDAAGNREAEAARRARQRSVLDFVREDARRLGRSLGANDRNKLDQYLTAVRELEQRLSQADSEDAEAVAAPEGLAARRAPFEQRVDLMYELIALALQTDRTRVVSFMLGNAGSNRSYAWLDVREGHHHLSHHGGHADKLAAIRRINRWHVERFAGFLARLDGIEDGDGTLLDQSAIVYASAIADGNAHRHHDLPVVLAGGAGGQLRGGRHLEFAKNTPMANLYLRMCGWMGLDRPSFGDSTQPLPL